jgi:hypothetical protein
MENFRTVDSLLSKLRSDVIGQWHDEGRKGNNGSAGNTLEDLLGISENNLRLPDWGDVEIKTGKEESASLLTLLHREPSPAGSIPRLILSLGWRHREAGNAYPASEMSFRSTTPANRFSVRGLSLSLENDRITLVFEPSNVATNEKDRTQAYPTYGDWLGDVELRKPHYASLFPVYWEKSYIENELRNKLDHTLLCKYRTRENNGIKQFKFSSAHLFKNFIPSKIGSLFDDNALYVDFDARTGHNHGTKFRVTQSSLPLMFDDVIEV